MSIVDNKEIETKLAAIVGADSIIEDDAGRTFFSTDLAGQGATTRAVVRVSSTDELSRVLALCAALDYVAIPRGGGFSYTGGYTPVVENSISDAAKIPICLPFCSTSATRRAAKTRSCTSTNTSFPPTTKNSRCNAA